MLLHSACRAAVQKQSGRAAAQEQSSSAAVHQPCNSSAAAVQQSSKGAVQRSSGAIVRQLAEHPGGRVAERCNVTAYQHRRAYTVAFVVCAVSVRPW
jgi:hypothetical protein